MLAYLEQAIFFVIGQPLIMGIWVALTTMLYLLHNRAHRYRPLGELRLFATSGIMGIAVPLATLVLGFALARQPPGSTRQTLVILSTPVIVILAFALTVTLVQKFMGADAETAMSLSWPITVITYVVPLLFCFLLSFFHQKWLTGEETLY